MTIPDRLQQFTDPTPVLDHGYVMLVDVLGDDNEIVQAARVSYAKGVGARKSRDDRQLLRYMLRNRHTSPFEQCSIKLEVKLPIFVERQWVRHRTAKLNEMSARYSQLPNEFYIPNPEDVRAQSTTNKQGRGAPLSDDVVETFRSSLNTSYKDAYARYELALDAGVARELARMLLPVAIYTAKVWQMDLHNLFHFLNLRLNPHAQKEIRVYAQTIANIVKVWVPWAWEAFEDYQLKGMHLTRFDIMALNTLLDSGSGPSFDKDKDESIDAAVRDLGDITGRERKELIAKLNLLFRM